MESDTDNAYIFVLLTNALESLVGVLVLQVFLRYFQKKIRTRLGQYLALLGGVYGIEIIFWAILEGRWSPVNILLDLVSFHPFNLIFRSHLLIGVGLLYHWRTREQIQMRKITEQEYQLLLLKELKTKAELEALQAKINPHFLYNALNSIASLVHEDPEKAEKMVLLLARFFRYSTQRSPHYYHSLRAELEW
ncbi:MAG: histidine kinase [Microscillaceae bacterium]|nr:histidine kinase [Microscillaceae bacterium]